MEIAFTEHQIAAVAGKVIKKAGSRILGFYGDMGAGKTTLIKALLKELGAEDTGSSPTFGIVNEYHNKDGGVLAYHFDFYRIGDPAEALDIGFEEYLDQEAWIFIEWPEKIGFLLPEDLTPVYIDIVDTDRRQLRM